jgi:hypothetical protein
MPSQSLVRGSSIFIVLIALAELVGAMQEPAKPPVTVKFHEPKTDMAAEASAPIDPTVRVQIQNTGGMAFGLNADGIRLTFGSGSIRTMFKIDKQTIFPNAPPPMPLLAKTPQGKVRHGFTSGYSHGKLSITHEIEAVPTRPAKSGEKRRLDAVLVRYLIENKDTAPHTIAARVRIDTHCNNDGALFAAPTFPKKILDGMEMKQDAASLRANPAKPGLEQPDQHGALHAQGRLANDWPRPLRLHRP